MLRAIIFIILALHSAQSKDEDPSSQTLAKGGLYATSFQNLKILAMQDQKIIHALNHYSVYLSKKVERIQSYVRIVNSINSRNSTDKSGVKSRELLTTKGLPQNDTEQETIASEGQYFQLLWSLLFLEDVGHSEIYEEKVFLETFSRIKAELPSPTSADRSETLSSVVNLARTYNLDGRDLRVGKILNLETNSGLSFLNLFELGNRALKLDLFKQAVDFLYESMGPVDNKLGGEVAGRITEKLEEAIKKHDKNFGNDTYLKSQFFNEPLVDLRDPAFGNRRSDFAPMALLPAGLDDANVTSGMVNNFDRLCAMGYSEPVLESPTELKCFLQSQIHHYWTLAPLQIELLHKDPFILQIYNVLSPAKTGFLVSQALPYLARSSTVGDPEKNEDNTDAEYIASVSFIRTSVNTWLNDVIPYDNPYTFVNVVTQKATGLASMIADANGIGSELIQVANYGAGGHYLPHVDALYHNHSILTPIDDIMGDRLATFMIYLNDVELGGGTAFPFLGVVARPVKGSALFWYNLHPNGTVDDRTTHGGCPVVLGTKWVANKWIRSNGQIFGMPCSRQGEEFQHFFKKYFSPISSYKRDG